MLINLIPTALVTCLAISQAVAAPVGIVMITNEGPHIQAIPPFRLGHAAANNVLLPPALQKPGCGGRASAMGRADAIGRVVRISNSFRARLGLPLIQEDHSSVVAAHVNGAGLRDRYATYNGAYSGDIITRTHAERIAWRRRGPFAQRLQRGLVMLGPWEGRAVSFVLGCGIGTLLRMLFVFAVLLRRAAKGTKNTPAPIRLEESTEDAIVPPPAYPDEKQQVLAEVIPVEEPVVEEAPKPSDMSIITVEKEGDELVVIWLRGDEEIKTDNVEFRKMYPQELIDFYTANLRWQASEDEE